MMMTRTMKSIKGKLKQTNKNVSLDLVTSPGLVLYWNKSAQIFLAN